MSLPALRPSSFFFDRTVSVRRDASILAGNGNQYPVDQAAGRNDSHVVVPGLESVACSIQPESGRPAQVYGKRQLDVDTSIYFAQALDVRPDDTLYESVSGATYVVQAYGDEAEQGRVSWVLAKRYI